MRSRAPLRCAALCVAASLLVGGCRTPANAVEPVGHRLREAEILQGFLQVTLKIPKAASRGNPAVIGGLAGEDELIAGGVVIVEYRQRWSALPVDPFQPPPPGPPASTHPVGRWLLAAPSADLVGRAYFQLIAATARRTLPILVDWLILQPEIDPTRIAIAGSSTNGFVALEALVAEPRLAAGVARVTCGDYRAFLRSSRLALDDDPRWLPDGELRLHPDYAAEIDRHQPIAHADALPPRPLLLQAGTDDVTVPFRCVQSTAERFASAYARAGVPERFRLSTYPGQGHALGRPAADEAVAFLLRWLTDAPDR